MKSYFICTSSPVDAVERLRFFSVPEVLDVKKIARHSSTTVYLGTDGRLYNGVIRHTGSYVLGRGRMDELLRCAAKLGVITRAQLDAHLKAASAADNNSRLRSVRHDFQRQSEKLGIVLTSLQKKTLAKIS